MRNHVVYLNIRNTQTHNDMDTPVTFCLGNDVYATLVNLPSGSLSLCYCDKFVDIAPTWNALNDALKMAAADVHDQVNNF